MGLTLQSSVDLPCSASWARQVLTQAGAACSVFPLLDSKGLAHDVHLSVETVDAPGSAIAEAIGKVAEEVRAALVVLGTNNVLVRSPVHACGVSPGHRFSSVTAMFHEGRAPDRH